jgi:hypothetical protein
MPDHRDAKTPLRARADFFNREEAAQGARHPDPDPERVLALRAVEPREAVQLPAPQGVRGQEQVQVPVQVQAARPWARVQAAGLRRARARPFPVFR